MSSCQIISTRSRLTRRLEGKCSNELALDHAELCGLDRGARRAVEGNLNRFKVPMHGIKAVGTFHESGLVRSSGFTRQDVALHKARGNQRFLSQPPAAD